MYDVESAVRALVTLYKAKLNDTITAINTEKSDSIVLATIPDDLYSLEVVTEDMLNYDQAFIMYSVQQPKTKSPLATNFIKTIPITFTVWIPDMGNANRDDEFYKILRYQRALESVIIKNSGVFQNYSNPSVTSLSPDAFQYGSKIFLNIGVEISLTISAH